MNNVNGKWVSNEKFREQSRDTAARAQELIGECLESLSKSNKQQGTMNSLINVVAASMREVERIDKIEAMKAANASEGTITIQWGDAPARSGE